MNAIVFEDRVRIPDWVVDLGSFRRWVHSKDLPEKGRFSFLDQELWVDLSMERAIHNLLKGEFQRVLSTFVREQKLGRYFGDGMMLIHETAGLATQPDGMFLTQASWKAGTATLNEGDQSVEVHGSPDMILEVVSETSGRKDTKVLKDLYAAASITEYWLVDSRKDPPTFEILHLAGGKYHPARKNAGWNRSVVFQKSFRLVKQTSEGLLSDFVLEVK